MPSTTPRLSGATPGTLKRVWLSATGSSIADRCGGMHLRSTAIDLTAGDVSSSACSRPTSGAPSPPRRPATTPRPRAPTRSPASASKWPRCTCCAPSARPPPPPSCTSCAPPSAGPTPTSPTAQQARRRIARALFNWARASAVVGDPEKQVVRDAAQLFIDIGDFAVGRRVPRVHRRRVRRRRGLPEGRRRRAARERARARGAAGASATRASTTPSRSTSWRWPRGERDRALEAIRLCAEAPLPRGRRAHGAIKRRADARSRVVPAAARGARGQAHRRRHASSSRAGAVGHTRERRYVGSFPLVIGRDAACQLALRDVGISRQHAARVVAHDDGSFALADRDSKNGTTLGGVRIVGRRCRSSGEGEHRPRRAVRHPLRRARRDAARSRSRAGSIAGCRSSPAAARSTSKAWASSCFIDGRPRLSPLGGRLLYLNGVHVVRRHPAHSRRRRRARRAAPRGRLMSLWGWLKDAFGGRPPDVEPEAELPAEEAFLRNLLGARRPIPPTTAARRRRRSRVLGGDAAPVGHGTRAHRHRSPQPLRRRAPRRSRAGHAAGRAPVRQARARHRAAAARAADRPCASTRCAPAFSSPTPPSAPATRPTRAASSSTSSPSTSTIRRRAAAPNGWRATLPAAPRRPSPRRPSPGCPTAAPTSAAGACRARSAAAPRAPSTSRTTRSSIATSRSRSCIRTRAAAPCRARAPGSRRASPPPSAIPGVVAVYDLDEERQLVAMELCTGGPLAARLRRGPLAPAQAIARAARALVDAGGGARARRRPRRRQAGEPALSATPATTPSWCSATSGWPSSSPTATKSAPRAARSRTWRPSSAAACVAPAVRRLRRGRHPRRAPRRQHGARSVARRSRGAPARRRALVGHAPDAPWNGARCTRAAELRALVAALLADDAAARPTAAVAAAALATLRLSAGTQRALLCGRRSTMRRTIHWNAARRDVSRCRRWRSPIQTTA